MENGDLRHALDKDNELLSTGEAKCLDHGIRARILYQVASAIQFLHTPVNEERFIPFNNSLSPASVASFFHIGYTRVR